MVSKTEDFNLLTSDLIVHIHTYYPRKHDVDSFIKFILDSLQGIIYKNDGQITELHVKKEKSDMTGFSISIRTTDLVNPGDNFI